VEFHTISEDYDFNSILYLYFADSVSYQILHLYFWHAVWIVWWHC